MAEAARQRGLRVADVESWQDQFLHRRLNQQRARPTLSEELVAQLEPLIQAYPTYGYRRLWALLQFHHGLAIIAKRCIAPYA